MFGGVIWVQVCVKSEKKELLYHTWWIIAINVEYASAAKAGSVSLFDYYIDPFHPSAHFKEHMVL